MSQVVRNVDDERRVALVDLLDRVLAGGVVISGDIKLAIADVDLVQVSLRALISSISTLSAPSGSARSVLEPPGDD
ncbi:gas vesicle protein [Nocardia jiangxiensis]|uniref:Gas vesicle protein n=1 Tax=Nocardia jiangxiensis TaxID=282685 RepID=A0ABW6SI59_9NOCA